MLDQGIQTYSYQSVQGIYDNKTRLALITLLSTRTGGRES